MHAPFVKGRKGDRLRWLFADLLGAKACWALAVSFAVVYLAMIALGPGVIDLGKVYLNFGLTRAGLIQGKLWQLVTHAFLHGNPTHLLINTITLLLIGSRVERIGGAMAVIKVFFAGVLAGGVVQVLLTPPSQLEFQLVGASGGITALLLWLTTVSPESRMLPLPISARNLGRGIILAEAGFLTASWIMPDTGLQIVVAHGCHLGGAIAGWWLGKRMFRPVPTLEHLRKERERREAAEESGDAG